MWLTLIFSGVFSLLVFKVLQLRDYWKKQNIPYEPLLKSWYRLLWTTHRRVVSDVLDENVKRYGKVHGSFRWFRPSLVVTDLELAKEVLIKQFHNFFERTFEVKTGEKLFEYMVSNLPYNQWKAVRTVMGYCFTSLKLKGIIPKFNNVANRAADRLVKIAKSSNNEIELKKHLSSYSLDSIVASSFGIDLNSFEDENSEFLRHATNTFKPGIGVTLFFIAPTMLKYIPFVNMPPKSTSKFFNSFGRHILDDKRKNLDKTIKEGTADILDNFLIAQREDPKNEITDEVLISQAFLFYMGGVDTTTTALQMATYCLAMNPDVQEKAYAEIKQVMGDRTEVEYEDVQKMKYLEATMMETLRYFPLSPLNDRICVADTVVGNNIKIKKGMLVEILNRNIHYDPKYFPQPNEFRPERFLNDEGSDATAMLTFGGGPKNCVGKRLAIMNSQVYLAKLLRKIKLEKGISTPPLPLQLAEGVRFTDLSKHPLVIKLRPRV